MKKACRIFGTILFAMLLMLFFQPSSKASASDWTEETDVSRFNQNIDMETFKDAVKGVSLKSAMQSGPTFQEGESVTFGVTTEWEWDFMTLCHMMNYKEIEDCTEDLDLINYFTGDYYLFFLDENNNVAMAFKRPFEMYKDQFFINLGFSFDYYTFTKTGSFLAAVGSYSPETGTTFIAGTDWARITVKGIEVTPTPEPKFEYEGSNKEYNLDFFDDRKSESDDIKNVYLKNVVLDNMSFKTDVTSKVSGKVTLTDAYDSRLGNIYVLVEDADGKIVDCAMLDTAKFKAGTTQKFSVKLNFYDRGLHKLIFVSRTDSDTYILAVCEKLKVTVDENAATCSLSFDREIVILDDSKQEITLYYTVPANNTEYELTIGKYYSETVHEYNFEGANILAVRSTELDELERDDAVHNFILRGDLKPGVYIADLTDLRTGEVVTAARFIVAPEEYSPFKIDVENNVIPFTYELSSQYLDFEQGNTMTIKYQYGCKYSDYCDALMTYFRTGYSEMLYNITSKSTISKVSYVPADGSKTYNLVYLQFQLNAEENLGSGFVRTVTLRAEDIYDYVNDSDYSILSPQNSKNGQLVITMGDDVVRINVGASAELISCSVDSKTKTRAYGEKFVFYTKDSSGGKIVAEIYDSKNKLVKKLTATSTISGVTMDETSETILSWDLTNSSGKYVPAGKYTAKIYLVTHALDLNGGKTKTEIKSEPMKATLTVKKFTGKPSMKPSLTGESGKTTAPLENPIMRINLGLNVGCKVNLKIKNSSGKVLKTYDYVWGSGSFNGLSVDLSSIDSNIKVGSKYTVVATGKTLDGKSCKGSATFKIVKASKPAITNMVVSLNNGNGVGNVSFKLSNGGTAKVVLKNSSGKVINTMYNQSCSAGDVKCSFATGSLAAGTYTVSVSATNSGGTSTASKSISIAKKIEKAAKPVLSNLKIGWITYNKEDALKLELDYKGSNTEIYYDIMFIDTEECVYSGHYSTKSSSGHVSLVWDGYKSNGFRAHVGKYFVRVYGVNSGGKTSYLKKNFTINVG